MQTKGKKHNATNASLPHLTNYFELIFILVIFCKKKNLYFYFDPPNSKFLIPPLTTCTCVSNLTTSQLHKYIVQSLVRRAHNVFNFATSK